MKSIVVAIYVISGLAILFGLCGGTLVEDGLHLMLDGNAATLVKAGSVMAIFGWFVELVSILAQENK